MAVDLADLASARARAAEAERSRHAALDAAAAQKAAATRAALALSRASAQLLEAHRVLSGFGVDLAELVAEGEAAGVEAARAGEAAGGAAAGAMSGSSVRLIERARTEAALARAEARACSLLPHPRSITTCLYVVLDQAPASVPSSDAL